MEIHHDSLEKVVQMACLKLTPEQKKAMQNELNTMVLWLKKLAKVDTQGVSPLSMLSYETNKLRSDEPEVPLPQQKALLNAPGANTPYFCVPAVKD